MNGVKPENYCSKGFGNLRKCKGYLKRTNAAALGLLAKPASFVLAESFDASSTSISLMPDVLYDLNDGFTAPVIEGEYLGFDTCLYCDDLRIVEAIDQFNADTFAPCPHCCSEDKLEPVATSFEEKLEPVAVPVLVDKPKSKAKFNMPAIYLYLYSQMPEDKMTIWERKHRDSLLGRAA